MTRVFPTFPKRSKELSTRFPNTRVSIETRGMEREKKRTRAHRERKARPGKLHRWPPAWPYPPPTYPQVCAVLKYLKLLPFFTLVTNPIDSSVFIAL